MDHLPLKVECRMVSARQKTEVVDDAKSSGAGSFGVE